MPLGVSATYVSAGFRKPDSYAGDKAYFNRDYKETADAGDNENKVITWFESDKTRFRSTQGGYEWYGGSEHYPNMLTLEKRGQYQSIYEFGIEGAHWGSGLSGLGGNIRAGELINDTPIKHALSIEVSGWAVVYYGGSDNSWDINTGDFTWHGFRWPADRNDNYAADNYGGTVQAVRMGSLCALSPTIDINAIGLTTKPGKKIAWTLQNYGAYIVDDSYGQNSSPYRNIFNICYHKGVSEEFNTAYGYPFDVYWQASNNAFLYDMDKIVPLLQVVNNNGPRSIGGGGNPRQCYAPAFADGTADPITTNPNGTVTEPSCGATGVQYPWIGHRNTAPVIQRRVVVPKALYTLQGRKISSIDQKSNGKYNNFRASGMVVAQGENGRNVRVLMAR